MKWDIFFRRLDPQVFRWIQSREKCPGSDKDFTDETGKFRERSYLNFGRVQFFFIFFRGGG